MCVCVFLFILKHNAICNKNNQWNTKQSLNVGALMTNTTAFAVASKIYLDAIAHNLKTFLFFFHTTHQAFALESPRGEQQEAAV